MRRSWPLAVLILGFPLWWVLGLTAVMPMLVAVPMAVQLLRQPTIRLPRGFGWWLLFLVWVALGAFVLWADAPGSVGGADSSRLLVFGYRLGWYLACTVVLLWIGNSDRRLLPDRAVIRLAGAMFVICTAGGLLGVVAGDLEFRSAVEYVLPGGLRSNSFVASMVHPEAADVQTVLGRPEARPKAPFAFTNTWGSCLALSLIFFVAALRGARRSVQLGGLAVAAVAAVPILYSLNRGLWASLALCGIGLLVLQAVRGQRRNAVLVVVGGVVALVLLAVSPLGSIYQERLDNQHSNERRGQLLAATVDATTHGSPVVGFGSTRNVQGSFASISGGSTADCPACGVPPLGTQGHLWLVIFSQGWFGALFFLLFMVLALARSLPCRTGPDIVCTFVLATFALQLPIYDTLGMPLFLVMIAIGLAWRARWTPAPAKSLSTTRDLGSELRRGVPAMVVLTAVGAGVGWYVALADRTPEYAARVSIALTPTPVYLDTGTSAAPGAAPHDPREITVDTEAALLVSERTLDAATGALDPEVAPSIDALRSTIEITAPPLSQVLDLTVVETDPEAAEHASRAVAAAYLRARQEHLEQRRQVLLDQLRTEQQQVDRLDPSTEGTRLYLASAINHLGVTSPSAGEVVREGDAHRLRTQVEVPLTSGAALGLLLGATLTALRRGAE